MTGQASGDIPTTGYEVRIDHLKLISPFCLRLRTISCQIPQIIVMDYLLILNRGFLFIVAFLKNAEK